MTEQNPAVGSGVPKSELLLQFWAFRRQYLARIRYSVFSQTAAEDIFQEACLKLLASNAVFIYPQKATRYFCRILHSLIMEHRKRAWRLEYRETLPDVSCNPWPEHAERQLAERVCESSLQLSPRDQGLLATFLSASGTVTVPRSTMRYRVGKVIKKLRVMNGEKP